MLIKSKIIRPGGTTVTLADGQSYVFAPRPGTLEHICEVEDPAAIQTFLAIPEGYAIFDPDNEQRVVNPQALSTSVTHDTKPPVAAVDPEFADELTQHEAPDADAKAPTDDDADDTHEAPTQADIDKMDEAELRAAYAVYNGRAAPANAKADTLRERLASLILEAALAE